MIQYRDFLDSASNILDSASCEMDYRNVMSRAYYAAYHCCLEMVNPYIHKHTGSAHQKVVSALRSKPNTKSFGNQLKDLHAIRITADYDLGYNVLSRDASVLLKRVEKLVSQVEELSSKA